MKIKKYLAYDEPNDQETIFAYTDKEAMSQAMRKFGITLLRLDGENNNTIITKPYGNQETN